MMEKEEKRMINILAKPVSFALFVDPQKTEAFLNSKVEPGMKERILRNAKRVEEQMKGNTEQNDVRKSD